MGSGCTSARGRFIEFGKKSKVSEIRSFTLSSRIPGKVLRFAELGQEVSASGIALGTVFKLTILLRMAAAASRTHRNSQEGALRSMIEANLTIACMSACSWPHGSS